jgi:abhydrolase domain-containing protein 17
VLTTPGRHGRRLYEAVPESQRFSLWVEGAGHNDLALVAGDSYRDALSDFVNEVEVRLGEGNSP